MIIRLKTGLQVGNQNSLSLGFAKWKEYTRNYTQYRRTMLEKYFEQVLLLFYLLIKSSKE